MAKRPRDLNQLAKLVVDIASGEAEDTISPAKREPATPKGRAGGLAGGEARAKALSSPARKAIAQKAAQKRWAR